MQCVLGVASGTLLPDLLPACGRRTLRPQAPRPGDGNRTRSNCSTGKHARPVHHAGLFNCSVGIPGIEPEPRLYQNRMQSTTPYPIVHGRNPCLLLRQGDETRTRINSCIQSKRASNCPTPCYFVVRHPRIELGFPPVRGEWIPIFLEPVSGWGRSKELR